MDKVVAEFGRVTTADPTLSSNEAICKLQEHCRTLMYARKTEHADEQGTVYSVTITIVVASQTSYVATRPTEKDALPCAISMTYDDLMHRLTSRMNAKYEPNNNNYELDSILASLRTFGYIVDISDRQRCDPMTFGLHYRIFFTIPGFGVYIGESLLSYLDAYKNGAELVKTAFYENIQKFTTQYEITQINYTLMQPNVELENANGKALSSPGFESQKFQLPPKNVTPLLNDDTKAPLLSVCDTMWIDLINCFNEVNLPARKLTEVIQELISMNLMRLTVVVDKFLNDKNRWQSLYITTLHFANYSFVSEELSEARSQEWTFNKTYSMMKKMSSLMKVIQKVYDSNRSSLEMMEELMNSTECSKIITERIKDCGRGDIEWRHKLFVITLGNMFRHEAYANTSIEAQEAAYWTVLNYLKNISEYIIDKPSRLGTSVCATRPSMPTTPAGSVPPTTPAILQIAPSVAATSEYRPAIADWVGPVSDEALSKAIKTLMTDLPPLTPVTMDIDLAIIRLRSLAKLIGRFNSVYTVTESPVEIMEHLFLIVQSFEVTTEKDKKLNICKVKHLDLGAFTGVSSSPDDAHFKAVSQTFKMLHKFAILSSSYKMLRSGTNSPAAFRPSFVELNEELVCEKTWSVSSHKYMTNFKVECLHIAFEEEGNSQEQSQERTFEMFSKFMHHFTDDIEGSITLNKPIHQEVTSVLGRYTYLRPVPISESFETYQKNRHDLGSGRAKVMELVLRFMQVRDIDHRRPCVEVIEDLMELDRKLYHCKTVCDPRRNLGNERYITLLNVANMDCFSYSGDTYINSKNGAALRFYFRLHILAHLVTSIQRVPLGNWTAAMVDYLCKSVWYLLTVTVCTDERTVIMNVKHIGEFVSTGESLEQAKVDVFKKMIIKVLALREVALYALNTADNAALEKIKMEIALDAANGCYHGDALMALRIKLVKDFEYVYKPSKCINTIFCEMATKNDTIDLTHTKCQFNGELVEHTCSISIIDMAPFHGCGKREEDSFEQANFALFQYLNRLAALLDGFKRLYSPSKPADQIINELLNSNLYHLISIKKRNTDNQNALCIIQLDRMRSIGRVGLVMEDAYLEAATGTVDYLKKLCQGVYGPM